MPEYDYEEAPKKSKYKNPDDMLRTLPEPDSKRHKRGIVAFVMGLSSVVIAFTLNIVAWFFSLALAGTGLWLSVWQRKIKRTKIASVAAAINFVGLLAFLALIILYFFKVF